MSRNLLRRFAVVLVMLGLLVPMNVGTASATSAYFRATQLPWAANMNICFGGAICGMNDNIAVDLPTDSWVGYVQVQANDNVGDKHGARLYLYIDGVKVGDEDVLAAGGSIIFPLGTHASQLVFRTNGDEVVMQQIYVTPNCWCI